MLVISNRQLAAFRPTAVAYFVEDMLQHAREFFPNHLRLMEEEDVKNTASLALEIGKRYGWTTHRSVCLLFNNMLLLGSHFIRDPQYPWTTAIVQQSGIPPSESISKLSDKVDEIFDLMAGPHQIHLNRALHLLVSDSDSIFLKLCQCKTDGFTTFFQSFYPGKYEALAGDTFQQAVKSALRVAQGFELEEQHAWPFVFFSLLAGSGIADDPQYQWAGVILRNRNLQSLEKSTELFNAGIAHLRNFIDPSSTEN